MTYKMKKPTVFRNLILFVLVFKISIAEAKVSESEERDEIFMLLSYALVHQDWQSGSIPRFERRGYNIGSVLVDPDNNVVKAALNSVTSHNNSTQHGEVRLMQHFLKESDHYNLDGFTIYTTLEPCAMCAGMMVMTNVDKVVYGQSDVDFAKALERLAFDSTSINGYSPYPRKVTTIKNNSSISKKLDQAFESFLKNSDEKFLSRFLVTDQAEEIFGEAKTTLFDYEAIYIENEQILKSAKDYYLEFKKDINAK